MWLENGGICHFEACWHPLSRAGYERNGWDERFEFNMTKGRLSIYTVTWNQPENNGVLLVHEDAASGCVTEHRFPPANAFHIEMAEMVRRFECREPGRPSVWDGYVVDEVIAQIAASSREKARVRMQWQDRA